MKQTYGVSTISGNFDTPPVARMQSSKIGKKEIKNSLQGTNKFETKSTVIDMFRGNVKKFQKIIGSMKKNEVEQEILNMVQECKNHIESTKAMMSIENAAISPEEGKKLLSKLKYIKKLISAIKK